MAPQNDREPDDRATVSGLGSMRTVMTTQCGVNV
jgi:hypothetical protein